MSAALADWLLSVAGAAGVVVAALEVPHGPVVDVLIDRGFVVYTINPKQLDAALLPKLARDG